MTVRSFYDGYGSSLVKTTIITEEIPSTKYGVSMPPSYTPAGIYSLYPNCSAFRVFIGHNDGIPPFASSRFYGIRDSDDIFVSFKKWDLPNVVKFVDSIPESRTGLVQICYAHEPEQGPSKGDPTHADYVNRWTDLGAELRHHPKRAKIALTPVLTNYYQLRNDWRDWLPWPAYIEGDLDGITFDIYNHDLGKSRYNPPVALYAELLEASRELELPGYVGECNTERISSDSDGSGAAQWFYNMAVYAEDNNIR